MTAPNRRYELSTEFRTPRTQRTQTMAALFCAMVAARKTRRSLPEFLRILPVSPQMKSMALKREQH